MISAKKYVSVWLFAFLTGCAALGLLSPENFGEKVAAGYVTVEAINSNTLLALQARRISPDDAENINTQADNLKAAIDIARAMKSKDPTAANAKLTAATTALIALQTYLKSKEGGK